MLILCFTEVHFPTRTVETDRSAALGKLGMEIIKNSGTEAARAEMFQQKGKALPFLIISKATAFLHFVIVYGRLGIQT